MSSEILIEAEHLSKRYEIYAAPHHRLLQSLVPAALRLVRPALRLGGMNPPDPVYAVHKWALRDVSLSVRRGETFGVIGVNGAGKSTLLQLICGTLTPTTGSVNVRGRIAAILELGSGFNPEFTGRENVMLYASVLGLSPDEIASKMDSILAFADIGPAFEDQLRTYSSGMAMRLAFAVIANVDADVLIVDEALAVGDAYFQQKCLRWLRGFRERGAVLFCGHDTSAVMNLCQRAMWLEAGQVRAFNDAKTVCESYLAAVHRESARTREDTTTVVLDILPASEPGANAVASAETPGEPGNSVIELALEASSSFGTRHALIVDARMTNADGSLLPIIRGGERVQVVIEARAVRNIDHPIVGFIVKDRLGQPIFGTNTIDAQGPVVRRVRAGESLVAVFGFEMPVLCSGTYSVTTALASGTLEDHVQHHWVHDALLFKVNSKIDGGIMLSVPMHSIDLRLNIMREACP